MAKATLVDRGQSAIDAALTHPEQVVACQRISELLVDLRQLRDAGDYFDFQRRLFSFVFGAQERRAEASRAVKRQRRGRTVQPAPTGDWELELLVAERIDRQYRSVGDALAWRLFHHDRRYIIALSNNPSPGIVVDKAGLDRELGEVVELWRSSKVFGLLHDLTTCLRIADVTAFHPRGPQLIEIKTDATKQRGPQIARIQQAIAVINEGRDLVGRDGVTGSLFRSPIQLKTHHRVLREGLQLADRRGVVNVKIGRGWLLNILSSASGAFDKDPDRAVALAGEKRGVAIERVLGRSSHRLRAQTLDATARAPAFAPFAIFPLDAPTCARLICDFAAFESIVALDRVAEAMERHGLDSECLLPQRSGVINANEPVMVVRKGNRRLSVSSQAVNQILLELIDLDTYAAATAELVSSRTSFGPTLTLFSNEGAVWR